MTENPNAKVYNAAMAGFQSAINTEAAKYQNAQLAGDLDGQVEAAQNLANYQAQVDALNRMAQPLLNPAPQRQGNPYGLSNDEIEIATHSHGHGSREDRLKSYAEQK